MKKPLSEKICVALEDIKHNKNPIPFLLVEDVAEAVEKLKKAIMINGNLKYRIIETEEGEFKKVRDEILNNIVIEYIDEYLGTFNNQSQDVPYQSDAKSGRDTDLQTKEASHPDAQSPHGVNSQIPDKVDTDKLKENVAGSNPAEERKPEGASPPNRKIKPSGFSTQEVCANCEQVKGLHPFHECKKFNPKEVKE